MAGLQFRREHAGTEQPAAVGRGGGGNPGPLESLGAHYYIGNTKIATMFASHGASRSADGLRGGLDELERWPLFPCNSETANKAVGSEPDMHLIKQVQQVTISALERPAGASPGFRP